MADFPKWLQEQLDARGWDQAEFSRISGIDRGSVSNLLSGTRGPGKVSGPKIAKALKVKLSVVLFHAGYSSQDRDDPTHELGPVALDIIDMLEERPESEQLAAKTAIEALFESLDRGKNEARDNDSDRATASRKKSG